jgi:hypothetical protein
MFNFTFDSICDCTLSEDFHFKINPGQEMLAYNLNKEVALNEARYSLSNGSGKSPYYFQSSVCELPDRLKKDLSFYSNGLGREIVLTGTGGFCITGAFFCLSSVQYTMVTVYSIGCFQYAVLNGLIFRTDLNIGHYLYDGEKIIKLIGFVDFSPKCRIGPNEYQVVRGLESIASITYADSICMVYLSVNGRLYTLKDFQFVIDFFSILNYSVDVEHNHPQMLNPAVIVYGDDVISPAACVVKPFEGFECKCQLVDPYVRDKHVMLGAQLTITSEDGCDACGSLSTCYYGGSFDKSQCNKLVAKVYGSGDKFGSWLSKISNYFITPLDVPVRLADFFPYGLSPVKVSTVREAAYVIGYRDHLTVKSLSRFYKRLFYNGAFPYSPPDSVDLVWFVDAENILEVLAFCRSVQVDRLIVVSYDISQVVPEYYYVLNNGIRFASDGISDGIAKLLRSLMFFFVVDDGSPRIDGHGQVVDVYDIDYGLSANFVQNLSVVASSFVGVSKRYYQKWPYDRICSLFEYSMLLATMIFYGYMVVKFDELGEPFVYVQFPNLVEFDVPDLDDYLPIVVPDRDEPLRILPKCRFCDKSEVECNRDCVLDLFRHL